MLQYLNSILPFFCSFLFQLRSRNMESTSDTTFLSSKVCVKPCDPFLPIRKELPWQPNYSLTQLAPPHTHHSTMLSNHRMSAPGELSLQWSSATASFRDGSREVSTGRCPPFEYRGHWCRQSSKTLPCSTSSWFSNHN